MGRPGIRLRKAMKIVGQSKLSASVPGGALGVPKNDNDDSLAAKKASSIAMQTDASAKTFYRFGDLPPEIRATIWAMAWPMRAAIPYISKPATKFECKGRRPCECCHGCRFLPPLHAPTIMQACREARIETQKISKPLSMWADETHLLSRLRPSWTNAQLDDFAQNVVFRDEMVRTKIWFNTNTDVIFFNRESTTRLSIVSGPFNCDDVFQAALDPATTFLLHVNLLDAWVEPEDGFRFLQNGLRSLYDRYLKTRDHIYICVGGLPILMYTDEGRRRAVREGLFSGDDEELRFVPVNDKALIKKYEASRHDCHRHIRSPKETHWHSDNLWHDENNRWQARRKAKSWSDRWISNRLVPSRENLSDAQLVMLQIADFLMWDKGLGYGKGEEIMELDGHLKKDHPLVQEHHFRLPEFTPVLVFETMTQEMGDCSIMLDRLPSMRPKYPEEDSSRARLFLRRWWLRRCWDPLMELWSRFR